MPAVNAGNKRKEVPAKKKADSSEEDESSEEEKVVVKKSAPPKIAPGKAVSNIGKAPVKGKKVLRYRARPTSLFVQWMFEYLLIMRLTLITC